MDNALRELVREAQRHVYRPFDPARHGPFGVDENDEDSNYTVIVMDSDCIPSRSSVMGPREN
jgi:hypothetical protein